jgi:predicted protein tyrosine phosphatase
MTDQQYRTIIDAEALARKQGKSQLAEALRRWREEIDSERREGAIAPF